MGDKALSCGTYGAESQVPHFLGSLSAGSQKAKLIQPFFSLGKGCLEVSPRRTLKVQLWACGQGRCSREGALVQEQKGVAKEEFEGCSKEGWGRRARCRVGSSGHPRKVEGPVC